MSFDQGFLAELLDALAEAGLQTIFIGNSAAVLHGVPVLTRDVDLMVRDHPKLEAKLKKFAENFDVTLTAPYEPTSRMIRCSGKPVQVDFVFSLSSGKTFESIRSRATRIRIGRRTVWLASLDDVIAAKEAAARPKDLATLGMLKDSLRVRNKMNQSRDKNSKES